MNRSILDLHHVNHLNQHQHLIHHHKLANQTKGIARPVNQPTTPNPATTPNKDAKKEVNDAQVAIMMDAMRNASDKLKFLKDLKMRDYTKFRSLETRNSCSRLQSYDLWYQAAKGGQQLLTNDETTTQSQPPPPTVRRVEVPDQVSKAPSIRDQVQSALQEALGPQGMQLLAEIQSVNSTINTDDDAINEESSLNSNNNTVNPYSNSVISSKTNKSNNFNKFLKILKQLVKLKLKTKPITQYPTKLPTIIEEEDQSPTTNVIAMCATVVNAPSSPPPFSSHRGHRAMIDSGATDTMTAHSELFESITHFADTDHTQPKVMLGDENTFHPVSGYGWINYMIGNRRVCQPALYIPALGQTTLISVKQHMKWKGNFFHAENNQATIAYPTFQVDLDTKHELSTFIRPVHDSTIKIEFNEARAIPISTKSSPSTKTIRMVSHLVPKYIPDKQTHHKFAEEV
jgi:hypothetical protein